MAALSAVVPGTKAKVAALDLASALREARYFAISRSTTVDVEFDLESNAYSVNGSSLKYLPRGMALVIHERRGYVSETRRVAGQSSPNGQAPYALRFYPDGSSNGVHVQLGPEAGGGWLVAVDWLFGGASVARVNADEA